MGKKWRDSLIKPEDIKFNNLTLESICDYLAAGNDVMECEGFYNNNKIRFILKIQRSEFADFESETKVIGLLHSNNVKINIPYILENGEQNNLKYTALTKLEGNKLSDILKNNTTLTSFDFLKQYGRQLSEIHLLEISANMATQRKINDFPKIEHYKKFDSWEQNIVDFLIKTKPEIKMDIFIHGDFHYGNILWNNEKKISGILDWEYSGIGFKEQDIAWALILRPSQKFMKTTKEIEIFLNGYTEKGTYDEKKLKWCLLNGYIHFYLMNKKYTEEEDKIYLKNLKTLIPNFM